MSPTYVSLPYKRDGERGRGKGEGPGRKRVGGAREGEKGRVLLSVLILELLYLQLLTVNQESKPL